MDNEAANIKNKIKRELADYLGVDMEDVEDDSILATDLHMDAVALTDFMEILSKAGFHTEDVELTEIETFEDLYNGLEDKS